jgi:enamine deaminase RidA (YjgF/YER057c/UK114 family)
VNAAGGHARDIGRMTIYVTDLDAYREARAEVGAAYRAHMGKHFPAMALVEVSRLVDPRGKVEIEATAVLHPHAAESEK